MSSNEKLYFLTESVETQEEKETRIARMNEEHRKLLEDEKKLDNELEELNKTIGENSTSEDTMQLLHKYNDVKDAAQIILGAIARVNGVTVASLHEKYNLPIND